MAKFGIVRHDGTIDRAEAGSLADAYARYGAPGDGYIAPWDQVSQGAPRFDLQSEKDQLDALTALAEGKPWPSEPAAPVEAAPAVGSDEFDAAVAAAVAAALAKQQGNASLDAVPSEAAGGNA